MSHPHAFDVDWELLDRYFSGEVMSSQDSARIATWMATPDRAKLLRSARELWDAAGIAAVTLPDVDEAWQSVAARAVVSPIASHDRPAPVVPLRLHTPVAPRIARRWMAFGAAAAIVCAVALSVGRNAWRRAVSPVRVVASAEREFTTRRAQRADLYLRDGTHVILNVESRLHVPADYGQRTREVVLDGEAYFDVVHDTTHPFRVRTATGVTEDIGTAFVVTHYPEVRGMQITVAEGEVRVWSASTGAPRSGLAVTAPPNVVRLKKGDLARVESTGGIMVRHDVPVAPHLAWMTGKLVFDRTPLRDVVPQLARWFDADIQIGDAPLAGVPYTAAFSSEPVEQMLELLAATLDARLERSGATYVLRTKTR